MKVDILASGSKGNLIALRTINYNILIDVGLSYRKTVEKLNEIDLNLEKIDYIFLTHEHTDHTKGLKLIVEKHPNIKVFLTKGTMDGLNGEIKNSITNYEFVEADNNYTVDSFNFYPMMMSHDAYEPVGYIFNIDDKKLVLVTDTGYLHESYYELIKNANLYILESNHDEYMLMHSPKRTHSLKMRILGEKGHLSNDQAAKIVNKVVDKTHIATWAVFHISEDCNEIEQIEKAIVKNLDNPFKINLVYTSQESAKTIEI